MAFTLEPSNLQQCGSEMYELISKLYPICRSITGDGVRKTLQALQQLIPLDIHEVPSGTQVYDWTVPKEWNVRDAYVKDSSGRKIIDFQASNLHLLNYSVPVQKKISLTELKEHLFTLPEHPSWIPYRTSYYQENWGFCLSYNIFKALKDDEYEVYIDSSLEDGHLTYGECYLPGETDQEVLFSCHICHPSLCNDNLSGIALATFLAKAIRMQPRQYSYRFLFIPGTIGSITWLALNEGHTDCIRHGLVISGVGDSGKMTYKKSRHGNAEIDRAVLHVLKHMGEDYAIEEFSPYGYDERQYCSPGINLPVGRLTRTPFGQYPEYHTSADNLEFVKPTHLSKSLLTYFKVVEVLENNRTYISTNQKCEPQLGKRGLYGVFGGEQDKKLSEMAMLWVLNYSDGDHSLLDIAEKAKLQFDIVHQTSTRLHKSGLLK